MNLRHTAILDFRLPIIDYSPGTCWPWSIFQLRSNLLTGILQARELGKIDLAHRHARARVAIAVDRVCSPGEANVSEAEPERLRCN
jgi:hypothetical protein